MKNQQNKIIKFDEPVVTQGLRQSWSKQSSSRWTEHNPACGQCSVTAIVIQKRFGGDILKTDVDGQWHFYNIIDGVKYDLTIDQFDEAPNYIDIPSSHEEALADTSQEQYSYLLNKFEQVFLKICDQT